MRKSTKIWTIIAAILIILGGALFTFAIYQCDWDFSKLSTVNYKTSSIEITEDFKNININTDTADIIFALSQDGKCRVECYEQEKVNHSAKVEEDTLVISATNNKKWYDYIGFNLSSQKITLYLPKTDYDFLFIEESTGNIKMPKDFTFKTANISLSTGDVEFNASTENEVKIKTSTGDIKVEGITAGALDFSVSTGSVTVSDTTCNGDVTVEGSTGKAELNDTTCQNLSSKGSTGDIYLKNVLASEKISIERSTGDVKFDSSDAKELFIETNTGDVTGTLVSSKIFFTQSDTGNVQVPKTTTGGKCEIITNTGDIFITIGTPTTIA